LSVEAAILPAGAAVTVEFTSLSVKTAAAAEIARGGFVAFGMAIESRKSLPGLLRGADYPLKLAVPYAHIGPSALYAHLEDRCSRRTG